MTSQENAAATPWLPSAASEWRRLPSLPRRARAARHTSRRAGCGGDDHASKVIVPSRWPGRGGGGGAPSSLAHSRARELSSSAARRTFPIQHAARVLVVSVFKFYAQVTAVLQLRSHSA